MTNFSQQLIDEKGVPATYRPIVDGKPQDELPLTIKVAVKGALLNRTDVEDRPDVDNVLARYSLWQKIKDQDEVELTADELSLLKTYIVNRFEIDVAGQIINLL